MLQLLKACFLNFCQRLWNGFLSFCQQHSVVGTRYLFDPNERIFWALVLVLTIFATFYTVVPGFLSYYKDNLFQLTFEDQPQFEVLEFPSVGICESRWYVESRRMEAVLAGLSMKYGINSHDENLKGLLQAITFIEYHHKHNQTFAKSYNLSQAHGNLQIFDELNYKELAEKLRRNCTELFVECIWHNQKFNCCEYFEPIKGISQSCFVLNSKHNENSKFLEMKVAKYDPNNQVELTLTSGVRLFLLNTQAVPEYISPNVKTQKLATGYNWMIDFEFFTDFNDPEFYDFGLNLMRCWPLNYKLKEPHITYKFVSYSACVSDCLRLLQIKKCGCIKHTLNEGSGTAKASYCNLTGYVCLEAKHLYSMHSLNDLQANACEHCLPTCRAYTIILKDMDRTKNVKNTTKNTLKLIARMKEFPIKRIRRQVIRNYLNISVLLGGIIVLFTGVSLVNVIELLYHVFLSLIQPTI